MLPAIVSLVMGIYIQVVISPFYIPLLGFALAGNALSEEVKKHRKRALVILVGIAGIGLNAPQLIAYISEIWLAN